jgi:hypothetical protein
MLEWVRPLGEGEPWDSVAIASMKFYAQRGKKQQDPQLEDTP